MKSGSLLRYMVLLADKNTATRKVTSVSVSFGLHASDTLCCCPDTTVMTAKHTNLKYHGSCWKLLNKLVT